MKKFKWDFIIVISLIIVATISVFFGYYQNRMEGTFVQVMIEDDLLKEFPLDIDTEYMILTGSSYNKLVIKDHCAYIEDADCRDRLCVNQGKISSEGQSIICLPHKVVVKIVSDKEERTDE